MSEQIHAFYKKNNIITDKQFRYQSGKSATQLLSTFTDKVYSHLDNKEHVIIININPEKTKVMYVSSSQNRSNMIPKVVAHSHKCPHNNDYHNCNCEVIEVVKHKISRFAH